ncbi:TonB-dependent receptor domain-containing protein [Horticoccus sp. 23ND18S-11]|uniref:TonB-dependent receptor domain-containing protein n=1 Tax=Horticoccus sp. 23ND18S-11 TaxID=3391832 RepID=UPI0039C8C4BA
MRFRLLPLGRAARSLFRLALGLAALPGLAGASSPETPPGTATAGARARDFDLPAQAAANALLAFAKLTKIEVLFSSDALRHARSSAVVGRFEPEEALRRLLIGTGFAATRNGGEKYVVTRETQPTGSIRGQLHWPDGTPAYGVAVTLPRTRHRAFTDSSGAFHLSAVPAGSYRLAAVAEGCEPLQFPEVRVTAGTTAHLAAQTLESSGTPAQLAAFVVKAEAARTNPLDHSDTTFAPRTAAGNLDLARTESDALPFTIYNREQIARSGVVNLNEFLQRELLDSDATKRPPEQDGGLPTFAAGSTNLNLRGYGSDQTIVLVNGRRLPEVLTNGGDATAAPDVNFIPLSLVQQVEVLPISASSLYSGNAVGGVINIVLRPGVDAEATEVALTYTNALATYDAPQTSASLLHSRALLNGKLRVRFNASVTRITPPTETELGFHQGRILETPALHASIFRATPNVRNATIIPVYAPGTDLVRGLALAPLFGANSSPVTSVSPGADGNGGRAAFAGREGLRNFTFFNSPGGLASSLDSIDFPYGREQRRTAYFGSIAYDVFPWLQLGFDGTFTRTDVHRGLDVFAADLRLSRASPFNPFQQDVMVALNETAPLLGENYSEARLEFGSAVLGAMLTLPAGWRVLIDGQYGRNVARFRGLAGADLSRWQRLIDQGRYNPLRDTQVFGPPREFYDQVLIYRGGPGRFVTLGDYHTLDAAGRVTHTRLPLPTGRGLLNFGGDYRRNELGRYTDIRRYADGEIAGAPIRWAGRTIQRYSAFGELQAPLLPASWLPPGVRNVDTDLSVRYIASDLSNEANVAPTVALKVNLAGGLALRGSITTSSRFPTPHLSRLAITPSFDAGTVAGPNLQYAYDPLRQQSYGVQENEVVNPDLKPEEALTQTAGILFQRGRTHRFRASLDYVDTYKANELLLLDLQTVLNLESAFPDRVQRLPLAPGDDRGVGRVVSVLTGTTNLAWRRSHNWNASVDYAWTECFDGTLELYGRVLHFSRYDRKLLPGSPIVNELSEPDGGTSGLLKYRAKFGTGWSNRSFGFGMDGHFFHSRVLPLVERNAQGRDRIKPYWQFDSYLQSELGHWLPWAPEGLRAQLRINNVFGFAFPKYVNDASGAGVQPYGDWRGRVYSLSLTTAF